MFYIDFVSILMGDYNRSLKYPNEMRSCANREHPGVFVDNVYVIGTILSDCCDGEDFPPDGSLMSSHNIRCPCANND